MRQLILNLPQKVRYLRARAKGVALEAGTRIGPGVDFRPGYRSVTRGSISIGGNVTIEHGATLHAFGGSIEVGPDVFIGCHAVIYGQGGVSIGRHSLIAMHCCILSSEHTVPPRGEMIRYFPDILKPTRIGEDVWLGAGVKVLGGVNIGDGCVVGAGAVVTRDLPAYSIATGVPARVVGQRA